MKFLRRPCVSINQVVDEKDDKKFQLDKQQEYRQRIKEDEYEYVRREFGYDHMPPSQYVPSQTFSEDDDNSQPTPIKHEPASDVSGSESDEEYVTDSGRHHKKQKEYSKDAHRRRDDRDMLPRAKEAERAARAKEAERAARTREAERVARLRDAEMAARELQRLRKQQRGERGVREHVHPREEKFDQMVINRVPTAHSFRSNDSDILLEEKSRTSRYSVDEKSRDSENSIIDKEADGAILSPWGESPLEERRRRLRLEQQKSNEEEWRKTNIPRARSPHNQRSEYPRNDVRRRHDPVLEARSARGDPVLQARSDTSERGRRHDVDDWEIGAERDRSGAKLRVNREYIERRDAPPDERQNYFDGEDDQVYESRRIAPEHPAEESAKTRKKGFLGRMMGGSSFSDRGKKKSEKAGPGSYAGSRERRHIHHYDDPASSYSDTRVKYSAKIEQVRPRRTSSPFQTQPPSMRSDVSYEYSSQGSQPPSQYDVHRGRRPRSPWPSVPETLPPIHFVESYPNEDYYAPMSPRAPTLPVPGRRTPPPRYSTLPFESVRSPAPPLRINPERRQVPIPRTLSRTFSQQGHLSPQARPQRMRRGDRIPEIRTNRSRGHLIPPKGRHVYNNAGRNSPYDRLSKSPSGALLGCY